jgi:glycolate oxidase FAD binding subunit
VSGAAHLPAAVAADIPLAEIAGAGGAVTALRLEGVAPSVGHRAQALQALLRPAGELALLAEGLSKQLWRAIRDVTPFAVSRLGADRPVWRVSTAPDQGARLAALAEAQGARMLLDWAGGLVWIAPPASADAGAGWLRRAVAAGSGHATLIRAPAAVRAAIAVFEPQDAALAVLTRRVKESFDPHGVLNRGRMYAGI